MGLYRVVREDGSVEYADVPSGSGQIEKPYARARQGLTTKLGVAKTPRPPKPSSGKRKSASPRSPATSTIWSACGTTAPSALTA